MSFCQACGSSVNSDARFCNTCGKPANISVTAIPSGSTASAAVAAPVATYATAPVPATVASAIRPDKKAARRHRPAGVIILAVLAFLAAIPAASLGVVLFGYASSTRAEGSLAPMKLLMQLFPTLAKGQQDMVTQSTEAAYAMFAIAAFCAVLSYGLWMLRKWGRIVAITFSSLAALRATILMLNAYGLFWNLFVIAINVWIVIYLMKPRVKQAFGSV
ncbi:MAG TPA: zinc ribbon domain-containing protein [Candidatus Koribacter sp.]